MPCLLTLCARVAIAALIMFLMGRQSDIPSNEIMAEQPSAGGLHIVDFNYGAHFFFLLRFPFSTNTGFSSLLADMPTLNKKAE